MHILTDKLDLWNIYPDELQKKIPALFRKGGDNNRLVLRYYASHGPSLPYDVYRSLNVESDKKLQYPTFHKRIKDLRSKGYLAVAGKRKTKRGKRTEETTYSLTWRGVLASIPLDSSRKNVFSVIKLNVDTIFFPNKAFILYGEEVDVKEIYQPVCEYIENNFPDELIEAFVNSLFLGFIRTSAPSIVSINTRELVAWAPAIVKNAMTELFRYYPESAKDLVEGDSESAIVDVLRILDDPRILDVVKDIVPAMSDHYERQIERVIRLSKLSKELESILHDLNPEDTPSEKIGGYLQEHILSFIPLDQVSAMFAQVRGENNGEN